MPEAYSRSRCGEGVAVEQDFSMYAQGQRRKGPALRRADGGEQQGENMEAKRDLCLLLRLTTPLRTVGNSCKPLPRPNGFVSSLEWWGG